jgi:hypothetical protein
MSKATPKAPARRRGRKPAGRSGETVGSYQHQFSVRIPGDLYHLMAAANGVLGRTHWQILEQALALYLQELSPSERQAVTSSAKTRQADCPQCGSKP